jgi:hypothetical protein
MNGKSDPGDGIPKSEIYEIWGDVIEDAADQGPGVINWIKNFLEKSYLAQYFQCTVAQARQDGRPFLTLQWGDMFAHIDGRPFGEHLDVYAILGLRRGLLEHPDPTLRIAGLEGWQRRDLQVFQTILKRAIEDALDALDDGRLR